MGVREGFACKVTINRAKTLIADSQLWILRIYTTTIYRVGQKQDDIKVRCFFQDEYKRRGIVDISIEIIR